MDDNRKLIIIFSIACLIISLFSLSVYAEEIDLIKSTYREGTEYVNYNHVKDYDFVYAFYRGKNTNDYLVINSKEPITKQTWDGIVEIKDGYYMIFKTKEEMNNAIFGTYIPENVSVTYALNQELHLTQNVFRMNEFTEFYSGSLQGDGTIISKEFKPYFDELNIKQHKLDIAQTLNYKMAFSEIISILPILLSVVILLLAIFKGISFVISTIRGA